MASQDHLNKMQLRQSYRNLWHTDLVNTIKADTPLDLVYHICFENVLFTMICQGIHAVLAICPAVVDVERADVLKCALLLRFFFALEIQWLQLDFCSKMSSTYKQPIAMIVGSDEIQEASQLLSCLSDMVYCSVCACMQTQHKIEMDKRDGKFCPGPMAVPPIQQMTRFDQPTPPAVGYPPPPYPYGQHPYPPQPQGYPPAGYQN